MEKLLKCVICSSILYFVTSCRHMVVLLPYLVPETGVVKPLQELLAHDHGAGEEGPVGQQEVLDVGGVHH